MSQLLQYNYVHISTSTGECDSRITTSYEINHPEWVLVPTVDADYLGKFYDFETETWFIDSEKTIVWEDAPQW